MKILQVNCVYKVGSTGKIAECIAHGLIQQGHEVRCLYGIGNKRYDNNSTKICGNLEHKINAVIARATGIPYGGTYLSNWRIMRSS